MAEDVRIVYKPSKTTDEFLHCDDEVRVIMGPFGSGKSSVEVLEILLRAQAQRPQRDGIRRSRWAVVRNTYRELNDTTRKTFSDWIPPALGRWNEQDFTFRLRYGDVDAEVLFRALDTPGDVKKLLSLELTGAYINELREIPKAIFDGLQARVGRYPAVKDGGCTWRGVWADTNPWHTGHWGYKLFKTPPAGFRLWKQPSGRSPQAENLANLEPGYYDRIARGKDTEWVRMYVDGFEGMNDVGSIFGEAIDSLERRGGLSAFEHDCGDIFTSWDLGRTDATAIWWWRLGAQGLEVLDWYENNGEDLPHYWAQVARREASLADGGYGWTHLKHWLPHDAAQKTLAAGTSVLNRCIEHWGVEKVQIGPKLTILDGIQAGRWLLELPGTRFHERCIAGLETLREYRKPWDEKNQCYAETELHNWASHTGAAWRYVGGVVKVSEVLVPAPTEPNELNIGIKVLPGDKLSVSLDEMWREREYRRSRR